MGSWCDIPTKIPSFLGLRDAPEHPEGVLGHQEGTVAVSQVGHTAALSPHHSREIKEGKPWESAGSELP